MAEKRGQYLYNDDGTVSMLVAIAGPGGELEGSLATLPFDHQATLVNTAVTHTNTVVAPASSSPQAAWQPVPEGMTEFINNLSMDTAVANCYTNVQWSEDGTIIVGTSTITVSNSVSSTSKTSPQWYPVGGAFYKVGIVNSDAAPKTCNASIRFRP